MTARKVDRQREMREADFAGASAPADYRSAALVWDRLQNRITPSLAAELGLCRQTLEDWGNPGRRKRGPHLLMAQAIELALELKPRADQRHDVLAPLDWLESRFGRLAIDCKTARHGASLGSQAQRIAQLLVEFAQFVDSVDDPTELDAPRRLDARQQLQDVIRGAMELLESIPGPAQALKVAR